MWLWEGPSEVGNLALQSCFAGGSTCFHLSLAVLVLKTTGGSCRDMGKRKQWLFFLLSGNGTVIMWVTGICSEAKDSNLVHKQDCT